MSATKLIWRRANAKYRRTAKGKAANRRANLKRRKTSVYKAAALRRTLRWRRKHPRKFAAQQLRAVVRGHGLTVDGYNARLHKQRQRCALCRKRFTKTNGPVIDHDHNCCDTGRSCGQCVCGIIHQKCNRGIGQLNDSSTMARSAYAYLRRTGR